MVFILTKVLVLYIILYLIWLGLIKLGLGFIPIPYCKVLPGKHNHTQPNQDNWFTYQQWSWYSARWEYKPLLHFLLRAFSTNPTQLTRIPHQHQRTTANWLLVLFFSVQKLLSGSIHIQRERHSPNAFPGRAGCGTATAASLAASVSVVSIGAWNLEAEPGRGLLLRPSVQRGAGRAVVGLPVLVSLLKEERGHEGKSCSHNNMGLSRMGCIIHSCSWGFPCASGVFPTPVDWQRHTDNSVWYRDKQPTMCSKHFFLVKIEKWRSHSVDRKWGG